ncbi:Zinc-finger homeodomain protein 6 [Camellia lanceoleosa]|uniref:Zinc-finger homeodomain protein 6 n=1 Tax=Camellia lanceoleosa TaxID=1840588 RepID=A0ACC0FPT7_9ERIC|nr:Zinc-finger homeodomain protein 6 [Camellia lanceoleosa]
MENNNGNLGHWASIVSYRECHKNHAISQPGGRCRHLYDGHLEFMNIVEENNGGNPVAALLCASRWCHQNFHRRKDAVWRRSRNGPHPRGDGGATSLLQLPILALSTPPQRSGGGGDGGENPNEDEYLGDGEVEEERSR